MSTIILNAKGLRWLYYEAKTIIKNSLDPLEGTNRLSSHKTEQVLNYIREWENADCSMQFIPLLIPSKAALLISPLDMGAISAFKANFYRFDRSTIDLKRRTKVQAWDEVSNV